MYRMLGVALETLLATFRATVIVPNLLTTFIIITYIGP